MFGIIWMLLAFLGLPLIGWWFGRTVCFGGHGETWSTLRTFITWTCLITFLACGMFLVPLMQLGFNGDRMPTLWAIGTLSGPTSYIISLALNGFRKLVSPPGPIT